MESDGKMIYWKPYIIKYGLKLPDTHSIDLEEKDYIFEVKEVEPGIHYVEIFTKLHHYTELFTEKYYDSKILGRKISFESLMEYVYKRSFMDVSESRNKISVTVSAGRYGQYDFNLDRVYDGGKM